MKDLPKRSITALLFAAVLLALIFHSFYSFLLLLLIVTTGGLIELIQLFKKAHFYFDNNSLWAKYLLSILFILYSCFDRSITYYKIYFLILVLFSSILFIEFLLRKNFANAIAEFLMLTYLTMFLMSALDIFYFSFQYQYIYYFPLSIVLIIWANDTFAYFTGICFGKHKLMPEVSPKKSIEGWIGGFIFSLITAFLLYRTFLSEYPYWSIIDFLIMSSIISSVGTAGDLVESKLKRLANVKDSGTILPGHGGILDRFDAWYLSIPAIEIYLLLKNWIL